MIKNAITHSHNFHRKIYTQMSLNIKNIVFKILATSLVGRPVRKLIWILLKESELQLKVALKLYDKHPFIRNLDSGGLMTYARNQKLIDDSLRRYYEQLRQALGLLKYRPKISVIIPVYKVKRTFLQQTLQSLETQIYENWEVCITDDASHCAYIDEDLEKFRNRYPNRVKIKKHSENLHISRATNTALSLATGDYVALFDHDDRLLPNALAEVVRFINLYNEPDILYSDESIIDEESRVKSAYYKPDWSPLMHLSVNYTTHLSVYRRALIDSIGGCRVGFEGAQDHDLMLRATERTQKPIVHIPINLYQWRSHESSTASDSNAKPYAAEAGIKAVKEACERRSRPAEIIFEPEIHHYRIKFQLPVNSPLISIIVLSKDNFSLVKPCLDSVFEKTTYSNFEIILVDHKSTEPDCIDYFESLKKKEPARFIHQRYSGSFNFAKMNNEAIRESSGEYLLFLNNDTEVQTNNWIEELLRIAQLPEVGAVGPKLLYPDGKIQHAGILGLGGGIAGHSGGGERGDSQSYFAYHQTMHETLGVTAACLMVKRSKFLETNGFEEVYVPNGFGDVDFCLQLRSKGYQNIYTPYAVLIHKESRTRNRSFELFEKHYMMRKWGYELLVDPYRNDSLNLQCDYTVDPAFEKQYPSEKILRFMSK